MFVLCENKLIVDGESLPIEPRLISIAVERHRRETGEDLRGVCGPVSRDVGRQIIDMERARSLAALGAAVFRRSDIA